jgi:hypothetical protein
MSGTKRRIKHRYTRPHLTEHCVRLFMQCAEIREAGDDAEWEENGGRRGELRDTQSELHRLLCLPPWALSPTYEINADPPAQCPSQETWQRVYALRQQLLAAAAEMESRDAALLAAIAAKAKKQR